MTLDPFWFKLLITFFVGGLWVTLTTFATELLGPKLGGWIGGLPSTVVVTLFFAGWTGTAQVASNVTTTIPFVIGINSLFLLAYAILSSRGFGIGLAGSLLVWFSLSSLPVLLNLNDLALSLAVSLLASSVAYFGLVKLVRLPPQPRLTIHYGRSELAGRAAFSGLVTLTAVALTRFSGPTLGGMFAAFPAVFISTLIITFHAHGIDFSRAITKTLILSGAFTVVVYAITARYLFLAWGIVFGTLGSYAVSILSAYVSYRLIEKRI